MDNIGVVGLGVMGRAMANNLHNAGLSVTGFDASPETAALAGEGVETVGSLAELVATSDAVLMSLPGPAVCKKVVEDIVALGGKTKLIIDVSTVDPVTGDELAQTAEAAGLDFVSAPVIGGEPGAVAGTLTIIVGGSAAAVSAADPFLRAIGEQIHAVDSPREACTLKLVNNLMSLGNTIVFAEGIALARAMGISSQRVYDIVSTGSGASAAFERRFTVNLSQQNYEPGFSVALAIKDLSLALDAAQSVGLSLPSTEHAVSEFTGLSEAGLAGKDVSALVRAWEESVDRTLSAAK